MKKLKTKDLFAAGRMLSKIDAKETIRSAAQNSDSAEDIWNNGFDLVFSLYEKASKVGAEESVYEFLSSPFEMSVEEIKELDLSVFLGTVKEFVEINKEELIPFFKSAGKSTK